MTDSVLQRFSVRSNDNQEPLDEEQLDHLGAFGWLRGTRDRAIMLELRKKDGNVLAVGYAWLDKVELDPSTGIILSLGGHKVTIRGRNLNLEVRPNVRLFQGICRHRVPWIQEADQSAIMEARNEGVIVEEIEW